ncbi:MAG: Yip1 family protein [Verrucomicrobiota bacterium]|nr:Yip1 family protein [Verrucomicrobiota bacterium]
MRAVQLLFSPGETWEKIALEKRSVLFIFFISVLPAMLLGYGVEAYSMATWGVRRGEFGHLSTVSQEIALKVFLINLALGTMSVFISAYIVKTTAESFHSQVTFRQTFAATAYSLLPVFLLHIFDAVPMIPTWACYGVGIALALCWLYHGVGIVMKPEQTKGFGIFIFSIVTLTVITAFTHFVGIWVMEGKLWKANL